MKNKKREHIPLKKPETSRPAAKLLDRLLLPIFLLLLIVICCLCFYNLGGLPAQDWDEARHGVSAFEMLKSGNYIVNTYGYENDYWNLKPPISFWAIMLGYKLFGTTLFGMRFYSAAAFFLTVVIASVFLWRRYGKMAAVIAAALFAVCSPFYRYHFARHGDTDALFTLFMLISMLSVIKLRDNKRYIYLCAFSLSLAFLSKSWHALMIVGAVGICLITSGLIRKLSIKQLALAAVCALVPILLWAAARYSYDGWRFLQGMVGYDLFARVTRPLEGHSGGPFYYLSLLFNTSITSGMLPLCIIGGGALLMLTEMAKKRELLGDVAADDLSAYLIWIFVPLVLISVAGTKLSWYLIPVLVPLILLTAIYSERIIRCTRLPRMCRWIVSLLLLITLVSDATLTLSDIKTGAPQVTNESLQKYVVSSLPSGIRSMKAYTDGEWTQGNVLVSELYHDFRCVDGGVDEFINDTENAALLLEESRYGQYADRLSGFEIADKSGGYVCIIK